MIKKFFLGVFSLVLSMSAMAENELDTGVLSFSTKVRCESWSYNSQVCTIGDSIASVELLEKHSSSSCDGRWYNLGGAIMVTDGCRATFKVTTSGSVPLYSLSCSSNNNKYKECAIPPARGVWITKKLSKSSCKFGSSWGYNLSKIWVSQGCRAEFSYTPIYF